LVVGWILALIDALFSLSVRRGWEGVGCFCFQAVSEGGKWAEDWVLAGSPDAWRRDDLWEPGGYGLRTLFDNFIGRKRDVDGGVLAGSFWLRSWEGPKR